MLVEGINCSQPLWCQLVNVISEVPAILPPPASFPPMIKSFPVVVVVVLFTVIGPLYE